MEKFARKCDVTGLGMNEGWYNEGSTGNCYFREEADVLNHIRECLKEDTELCKDLNIDLLNVTNDRLFDVSYNHLGIYWTEWDADDEDEYYNEAGDLFESE